MLTSELFAHIKDLSIGVTDNGSTSAAGLKEVVQGVQNRDALSVVADVYKDLNELLQLPRIPTESFRSFQLRYTAQVSEVDAHGCSVSQP